LTRYLFASALVAGPILGLVFAGGARAGETPLYQPTPDWVIPARLPDPATLGNGAPAMLIFDGQQRIADGMLWAYVDTAQRIVSPEQLNQLSNLNIPWLPDKGDLRVHELSIIRGGETIDLLAGGKTFTVLRREQNLEQRELTGVLTATMAVEGLRTGDILRMRFSTTSKDKALAGHVQGLAPVLSAPMSIGQGRLRALWANDSNARWKLHVSGVDAKPVRGKAFTELSFALPAPKQPEIPTDAPGRYRTLPLLEVSTFADWADVSRAMYPLFRADGLIPPGSPLLAEIDTIMKAEKTPLGRAQKALQLVQDKIRYLAVSMDGGNYVPQTPEQTWALRYGDCKAKTLLLLALLRKMGIEAEPVLAHTELGDLVVNRLPSAAAFNHIIVRAVIDGESLWLDGTGLGARIEDIHDTPPFRNVLPLRETGAGLMTVDYRRDARPTYDMTVNVDESMSVDLPNAFDLTLVLRGRPAMQINLVRNQLDAARQREVFGQFLSRLAGESQFSSIDLIPDETAGIMTIKARGVTASSWRWDDKAMKRAIDRGLAAVGFEPDRARAAWSAIPVATPPPEGRRLRMTVRLPDGGRGFRIDGQPALTETIAGYEISRAVKLDNGVLTMDERIDSTGAEIPAAQAGAERDRLATAKVRAPKLIAPPKTLRRWDLTGKDAPGATQIAAVEAVFTKAIANDPDEVAGYRGRATFRRLINDGKGALADLDKAIAIEPDLQLYFARSQLYEEQGNLAAALRDVEAARQLDPSSAPATVKVAYLRAEGGDLSGAVDLLDQRIELGGETRQSYNEAKASLLGRFGDPAKALALVETLIADRPGTPTLLNLRCWIKGTREVALETAAKDCTSALELSSNPYGILDSRALVSYRLGRYEDAMRDLDAVLNAVPAMAESRFMRGVVLARMDRKSESDADLEAARRLKPRIDQEYARYGIKP
jgi:tetratricopeptide (TPR) repeat protein